MFPGRRGGVRAGGLGVDETHSDAPFPPGGGGLLGQHLLVEERAMVRARQVTINRPAVTARAWGTRARSHFRTCRLLKTRQKLCYPFL